MTFPTALDTGLPDVTDFLPAGVIYEPGSMVYTNANTIPPNRDRASTTATGRR